MKSRTLLTLVFGLLLSSCGLEKKQSPTTDTVETVVAVEGGLIFGLQNEEKSVAVFKGIPYAQPPLASLRWKPPQAVSPWEGIKDCTSFQASPIQPNPAPFYMWSEEFLIPKKPISEDALYLNIWAPTQKSEKGSPVLVWIHGGGFSSGSGSVPIYDGEALAKKGVVYVSINYRLGLFGFLAHPELTQESENQTSGNYGLMDQIAALKWIQNNIEKFGGNPAQVTIAGQSAGGASVAFLVGSPQAKGLFSKAIIQSGAGFLPRTQHPGGLALKELHHAEKEGKKFTDKLEVPSMGALRKIPALTLLEKSSGRWQPIQDHYLLPQPLLQLFREGKNNKVAVLTGWNQDDGILIRGYQPRAAYENTIRTNWKNAADTLLKFYPATNDTIAKRSQGQLERDLTFGIQNYTLANLVSNQNEKVYMYRFTRDLPDGDQKDYGAFHTGEVPYALNTLQLVNRPFEPIDLQLEKTMASYWVNFATTGNPNAEGLPEWPIYNPRSKEMMLLGEQVLAAPVNDSLALDFLVEKLTSPNP